MVELTEPSGWVVVPLKDLNDRLVRSFMIQIAVTANHQQVSRSNILTRIFLGTVFDGFSRKNGHRKIFHYRNCVLNRNFFISFFFFSGLVACRFGILIHPYENQAMQVLKPKG